MISQLLKLEKKMPYLTIMAVFLEDRILSVADLKRVSELPDLDLMRATLCQTLGGQAQLLSRNIMHHQVMTYSIM